MKVKDKTIVVTGAGSGMGRELSLQLIKKGARVAMVDLNEDGMKETARLSGVGADFIQSFRLDISNKEEVFALPQKVIDALGGVDGLINNAGIIQPFVPVKDLDLDMAEKVMRVNFFGSLYMCKAFLPYLAQRPEAHILNVSSMGGFMPFPGQTLYGASKAALKLLTEGMQSELRNSPIGVSLIYPGAVNTDIMHNSGVENISKDSEGTKMKITQADDAARQMIEAIEYKKAAVYIGKDARMLIKLYRLAPVWSAGFIAKQMEKLR